MRKLTLIICLLFITHVVNAQIKVWPGGGVAIGTTSEQPSGSNRSLFWGPVNIKQSNVAQSLLTLDALNEQDKNITLITNIINPYTWNYVLRRNNMSRFYVDGLGRARGYGFLSFSDSTLKTQITTIDSALYKLLQLRGVSFKYKEDIADTVFIGSKSKKFIGVLAQEMLQIMPEAVDTTDSLMSVDYPSLVGLLIEGIKDLNTKVENNNHWKLDTLNNIYRDTLNVGIGTATPTTKLDVTGTFLNTNNGFGFANTESVAAFNSLKGVGFYSAGGTQTVGACVLNVFTDTLAVMFHKNNNGSNVFGVEASKDGARLSYKPNEAVDFGTFVWVDSVKTQIKGRDTTNSTNTVFYNGNYQEVVRIQNDGFVSLGAETTIAKLTVYNETNGAAPTIGGYFEAGGGYNNYGIKAYAPIDSANNYAGYFQGDVVSTGTYYTVSDERLKTNITKYDVNALDKIKTLNVKTYSFNPAMQAKHNLPQGSQIGIMAQDIEKQWPNLVRTGQHLVHSNPNDTDAVATFDDFKVVNYNGLIPVLVKGIQELSAQPAKTDSLLEVVKKVQAENTVLKDRLTAIEDKLLKFDSDLQYCCFNHNNQTEPAPTEGSKLEQNNPNPFSENTTIRYYIARQSGNAIIRITNTQGTVVNTFKIDAKGAGQILLSGSTLTAGTYVYELIIDGKQVDYKRMVLTY